MNLRHFSRLWVLLIIACACLITGSPSLAASKSFSLPPSSHHRFAVNGDWRAYRALRVPVTLSLAEGKASEPVQAFVFFETKSGDYFESAAPARLKQGEEHTFELSLDADSPHWQSHRHARRFDREALRWVTNWGIKLFSHQALNGEITIGDLTLKKGKTTAPLAVTPSPASTRFLSSATRHVTFYISGFEGNPYNTQDIKVDVSLEPTGAGESQGTLVLPAYWRRDYILDKGPWGDDAARVRGVGNPYWAVHLPAGSTGEYRVTVVVQTPGGVKKFPLVAKPDVGQAPVANDTAAVLDPSRFIQSFDNPTWFKPHQGDWTRHAGATQGWHVALDWTTKWGRYTGWGEYDAQLAWEFEQVLLTAQAAKQQRPLVLFSEAVLDNRTTYNWQDHPGAKAAGGVLSHPRDVFHNDIFQQRMRDKLRYLQARYGHVNAWQDVLVSVDRPNREVKGWLDQMRQQVAAIMPRHTFLSNNRGLPTVSFDEAVVNGTQWKTDQRLSKGTSLSAMGNAVVVKNTFPASAAIVAPIMLHGAHGAQLAFDVHTPQGIKDEMKAMIFLRIGRAQTIQSELQWLRGGDVNRVMIPLTASAWKDPKNPSFKLSSYHLLNVKEIGMRFFYDEKQTISLDVGELSLLGGYQSDVLSKPALRMKDVTVVTQKPTQWEKLEWRFDLNRVFKNPYDPHEVRVDALLIGPDGKMIKHPGYFAEGRTIKLVKDKEVLTPTGNPYWAVRMTPAMAGAYRWKIMVTTASEKVSSSGKINVRAHRDPGFVQLSAKGPRNFQFSNGDWYYPLGLNVRSPSERRPNVFPGSYRPVLDKADAMGVFAFEKWFTKMNRHKVNFARVWMCPWWLGLEWKADYPGYHGVGYYNQDNAARMDRVMELAEKNGVYLNIEMTNHGQYSTKIDREWHHNPFNRKLPGGLFSSPNKLIESKRGMRYIEQRYRYTIARWGYSRAIAFWGISSETDWTEPYWSKNYGLTRRWLGNLGRFIKKTDGHKHVVTTHFSNPWHGNEIWPLPELEVTYNNAYTSFHRNHTRWQQHLINNDGGVVDMIVAYDDFYRRFKKPSLLGEWGGHHARNTLEHLIAEWHTGLWASVMTNLGGATGYWWWNLVDHENLWGHVTAISVFLEGENRLGFEDHTGWTPVHDAKGQVHHRVRAVRRANTDMFWAYVYNKRMSHRTEAFPAKSYNDPGLKRQGDCYLVLPPQLAKGKYTLQFYDSFTGKVLKRQTLEVTGKPSQKIHLPAFTADMVVKVSP